MKQLIRAFYQITKFFKLINWFSIKWFVDNAVYAAFLEYIFIFIGVALCKDLTYI